MSASVGAVAEAPPTVLTRVVSFLQVHRLQMSSNTRLRAENGAAKTTHPPAVLHQCEAVLNGGGRVRVSGLQTQLDCIMELLHASNRLHEFD